MQGVAQPVQQPAAGDGGGAQRAQHADTQRPTPPPPGVLVQRINGARAHFCSHCTTPIAVYGRLIKCCHTFCLACATAMAECYICGRGIDRVERVAPPGRMFIHPATLQGFHSEQQLALNAAKFYAHICNTQAADLAAARQLTAQLSAQHAAAAAAAATAAAAAAARPEQARGTHAGVAQGGS